MTGLPRSKLVILIACLLLCVTHPGQAQQSQQQTNARPSTALSLETYSLRIATARQTLAYARQHPDDQAVTDLGNSLLKVVREDQSRQQTQVGILAASILTGSLEQFDQQISQRISELVPLPVTQAVQSLGGPAAIMQNSSKIIADSVGELGNLAPQRRGDAGGSLLRLAESAHAQGAPKCAIFLLAMVLCAAAEQPGCVISMGAIYYNCENGN